MLDSGGLSALFGRSTQARIWLRWVVDNDGDVVVPVAILSESTTGDGRKDAEANRVLSVLRRNGAGLTDVDEPTARRAGSLRHRAGAPLPSAIDALVAAEAAAGKRPCVILTSDPADLERLVGGADNVTVKAV